MCDMAHDKASITERIYNARENKSKGGKIPFGYLPENFKSRGFNRSKRVVAKVTIPIRKILNLFKRRK